MAMVRREVPDDGEAEVVVSWADGESRALVVPLAAKLAGQGIWISVLNGRGRACTHLDVTAAMVEEAADAIRTILRG
jgi:hypothetical protein